jgi:MFS superfamily sulfate permease-like transporter
MAFVSEIKKLHRHNVQTLRKQPLSELSGALGDIGTLLPIMIALTLTHSISISSTLVFTGLSNILTGVLFGIPLPVQPMKAIAAIAIAQGYTIRENMAAGLTVAAIVLILSITGLLNWFSKVIPIPVVKGIQVGAGLSLVLSAGSSLLQPLHWTGPSWADNYLWALLAFFLLLATTALGGSRFRIPYALLIVVLGLILGGITLGQHHHSLQHPSIWHPHIYVPHGRYFWTTLSASLGQLPLTTLNSIIAVSHLSGDLLPELPEPSPTALGISVACMNLVSCWFGSMPACHGSGGLAGQYRFGARSGASIIILGVVKLILGLSVGEALFALLREFPKGLLGVMVIAAGVELAKVGESLNAGARDLWEESSGDGGRKQRELGEEERRERWSVMLVTVAGLLAFRNDAIGFLAGLLWHYGLHAPEYASRWRSSRSWMGRFQSHRHEDESLLQNHEGPERRVA